MPVSVQNFTITSKSQLAIICRPIQQDSAIKVDLEQLVNFNFHRHGRISDIIKNIIGVFSVEDLAKINKIKQEYISLNIDEIKNIHKQESELYVTNLISKLEAKPDEGIKNIYIYAQNNLTNEVRKIIKEHGLKLAALKQLILRDYPRCNQSYDEWIQFPPKLIYSNPSNTIFEHPVDKVTRITGDLTEDERIQLQYIVEKNRNKNIINILEEKTNIINKIHKYLSGKNTDFHGQFKNNELDLLKKLAIEYKAFNQLQMNYGYSTKELESVLYSDTKNFKVGEYIEGLGIITDELTVNGTKAIIAFKYDDGEYSFKMYNKDILEKKDKVLSELPETIYLEDLRQVNEKIFNTIIKLWPLALISEIRFKVMEKDSTERFMEAHNLPKEYADKIMKDNKYAYLIQNFKNHSKQKCPSAARIIAVKLLNLLKEKNAYPILAVAQPYDSTHSPVSMYLRVGFKPLSRTFEDVQTSMSKHFEYTDNNPLIMYLPNFEENEKIIESFSKIYFK